MQHGDIANSYPRRNVVVLTPLLMAPIEVKRKLFRKTPILERYTGNAAMLTWMVAQARTFNTPWEVWSFDDEEVYYDADIERKELWWQLHGVHIPVGGMP